MNKIEKIRKLYELESLVSSNGDAAEINKLRKQLNISFGGGHSYKGFCPDKYKKMKSSGMLDKDIQDIFGMSHSGLYKNKVKFGLL